MEKRELLFDGDLRGYRTGKDCVLELVDHDLWKDSISLTDEERATIESEGDDYLEIIDAVIDNATCTFEGHTWSLGWEDGSIFAYRDDYECPED